MAPVSVPFLFPYPVEAVGNLVPATVDVDLGSRATGPFPVVVALDPPSFPVVVVPDLPSAFPPSVNCPPVAVATAAITFTTFLVQALSDSRNW